ITDAPDPAPVREWLTRLPFDDLVLFTGEGLRRLHRFARRVGLQAGGFRRIFPARQGAPRPQAQAGFTKAGGETALWREQPTTDGLIATLSAHDLHGRRVGVQLYPGNPNTRFTKFLREAGAEPDTVLPYVYAAAAEDAKVVALIDSMARGEVEVIAFTSSPQVNRLFEAAVATGREAVLYTALERTAIAAVGPVVAEELRRHRLKVTIAPDRSYFIKALDHELQTFNYFIERVMEKIRAATEVPVPQGSLALKAALRASLETVP